MVDRTKPVDQRRAAAALIGDLTTWDLGDDSTIGPRAILLDLLEDPAAEVRRAALEALPVLASWLPIGNLALLVADKGDVSIRRLAIEHLLHSSGEEVVPLLQKACDDEDSEVRRAAASRLAAYTMEDLAAGRGAMADVIGKFAEAHIFALGQPAGKVTEDGGTESDLLHFTANDESAEGVVTEVTYLPVFTRPQWMVSPLDNNPGWQSLSVLELDGRSLFLHVDDDVTIVINPWSKSEYKIRPADRAAKPV